MNPIKHKKRIQGLYTYKGRPTIMIATISYVDIKSIPEDQSVEEFVKANFPETESTVLTEYKKSKASELPEADDQSN